MLLIAFASGFVLLVIGWLWPATKPFAQLELLWTVAPRESERARIWRLILPAEALDFGDAEMALATQQWDLARDGDPTGLIEYPTQFSRFQNVSKLSLFVVDNHGAENTRIYYIGLKGVGTTHQRRAVQAVYEVKPQAAGTDICEAASAVGQ